jgi:gentisate 1,2-dioxygenase
MATKATSRSSGSTDWIFPLFSFSTRPSLNSDARYGANLLPVDHDARGGTSPVFNYPYARTRYALEPMRGANA